MPPLVSSIKGRIILNCAIISVIIGGMIVASEYMLGLFETRIDVLGEMTKLEEVVQELRRSEKNLFLYGDKKYGERALFLAEETQRLLDTNRKELDRATSPRATEDFGRNLKHYRKDLEVHLRPFHQNQEGAVPDPQKSTEERIRKIGSELSHYATTVARKERTSIEKTVAVVRSIQIGQLILFAAVMAALWVLVFKKIVHPLRLLEEHTAKIALGRFEPIEHPPKDKEIAQIFDSFNRMTDELRTRQAQLVRAQSFASLGTLVAGVSHEVNTPLSNIRFHGEVLMEELEEQISEETPFKKFFTKKLNSIIRDVDRALKIVHDLLSLSGNKDLALRPLLLKRPVEKAADLLGSQIPPGVEVVIDIGEDTQVHGDDQRLTTVFMNLIANASAAIDGTGKVVVRAEPTEAGMVEVSVRDNGRGMPEDVLEKIFDPFFTTNVEEKGRGMGLFVTHEIVTAHRGHIWAESVPAQGTTVRLRLPARGDSE